MKNKNIVLGVCGGIAAYKAVDLVSRLVKAGAHVRVIMTQAATKFVTPLTFREISGNPVISDMWEEPKTWHIEHIALAAWADLFVVAPATANLIGKIAAGIADDMLTTTIMATTAPIMIVPAMNSNMYMNPIMQRNQGILVQFGYQIMEPNWGKMACGTEGPGRLPEPKEIYERIADFFCAKSVLQGCKVVVTAAGTREPIDPVRYIGNRSSGKMGYALAYEASKRGADVVLISGPTHLPDPIGVKVKRVETTAEMRNAVLAEYSNAKIVVKAAAVADFRPAEFAVQKIKKQNEGLQLKLEKNPDILLELGQCKQVGQILIGFAAETENLLQHATEKLAKKNLDLIVANDITQAGAGFNVDTNIVKLLYASGEREELPQMSKAEVAKIIFDRIEKNLWK